MTARRHFARIGRGALLLAVALAAPALSAQTTGSIAGWITDATGATLPGATLNVSGASLQGTRSATAGRDGKFWLPALPPGAYTVHAKLAGFRAETQSVAVSLGSTATISFALEPAVEEAISVAGEAPVIDVTSTTGGTSYSSSVVSRLPVDRNYAEIVRSNPGVGSDFGDTQGRAPALTVYGATSAENQWIVDGVDTTGVFKGQQGKSLSMEFISEVQVKTDGYSPEYGRALGGVINVVTKSGGNQFHGDGFVYADSSATTARQVFYSGVDSPSGSGEMRVVNSKRFDYGFDLGGFILKDRLWFFAAYNRVALQSDVSRAESTPDVSTEDRFPFDTTENLYSGKLTWNLSSATTVIANAFADPSTGSGADGVVLNTQTSTWYSARQHGGTDYSLRGTQLLGALALASLQGSYHHDQNETDAAPSIRYEDWKCVERTSDNACVSPNSPNGVWGGYGWIDGEAANNGSRRWQYLGDVTYSPGNHELKAGADYRDGRTDMTYRCTGGQCVQMRDDWGEPYYQHTFTARGGDPLQPLPTGAFSAAIQDTSIYLQDSWRPAAGLTVNIGLRWESERLLDYQGITRLDLTNEWQPRLGIVWDPWENGQARLYASAGRYYYAFPTVATNWWFGDASSIDTYNHDPVSTVPDPSVAGPGGDFGSLVWFGGGPWGTPVDEGLQGAYQDELTIGFERLFGKTTVGIKGTARRLGNVIEDRCDLDPSQNADASCAVINPGSNGRYASGDFDSCTGLDTTFDGNGDPIYNDNCAGGWVVHGAAPTPAASRLYRGIQVLARESIGASLWLQASYVYSSLRGNYDGGINEGQGESHPGGNSDFDFPPLWQNADGRLNLDRPHRFRLDGYWVTPLHLAMGLQFFVESGAPVDRRTYFCCGGWTPTFLVPRGSAGRLPTVWEGNLNLSYPIQIGPASVTFLAYVFNLFNNQTPTDRDVTWSTAQQPGYPDLFDPTQPEANDEYGLVRSRTDPRLFRAAVRVSF